MFGGLHYEKTDNIVNALCMLLMQPYLIKEY